MKQGIHILKQQAETLTEDKAWTDRRKKQLIWDIWSVIPAERAGAVDIRQLKALEWAEKASKRPKRIFNMSRQERGLTGYNKYGKKQGASVY